MCCLYGGPENPEEAYSAVSLTTFIFPLQVLPSICSMIPLLLSLLAALVLTQAPAALADDLKEDSSGEQPSREPLSLLDTSLPGQRAISVFSPSHLLPA